jgi:3-hydroxyacyl-[acyl-carrier-protein] dehydratase
MSSPRKCLMDIEAIKEVLPHRYPFLLIDRVLEIEDSKRIVCQKNVSANEPFFQGHFPDQAVMPGVLILEAMAQASAILAAKSTDGIPAGKKIFFAGANEVKWKRPVVPGDSLIIAMEFLKKRRPFWMLKGSVRVDDVVVAEASITAAEVG